MEFFYFQVLVYVALLLFAIKYKSPVFFVLVAVLSFATAVQVSAGIDYFDGWSGDIEGTSTDMNFSVNKSYAFENVETSDSLRILHYLLLLLGFVWLITGLGLANKAGTFNVLKGKG